MLNELDYGHLWMWFVGVVSAFVLAEEDEQWRWYDYIGVTIWPVSIPLVIGYGFLAGGLTRLMSR